MLQEFFDWALAQPNVWFVTPQQLLTWMKEPVPVPASKLKDYAPFKCQAPKIDKKICNGLTDDGLLETCSFQNGSWSTCYGCPSSDITVANPVPSGMSAKIFIRLPRVPMSGPNQASPNGSNSTSNGSNGQSNGQKSDASSLLSSPVLVLGLIAF
ncbi:6679_t:CDS:2, partial [Racocetra fulgida]